jgi:hypothetical protein
VIYLLILFLFYLFYSVVAPVILAPTVITAPVRSAVKVELLTSLLSPLSNDNDPFVVIEKLEKLKKDARELMIVLEKQAFDLQQQVNNLCIVYIYCL